MTSTAVLPLFAFPNLDYFKILLKHDSVLFEVFETFPKQTFRNRYQISGPHGSQNLIVPLVKADSINPKTNSIRVSYDEDWQIKHWRTIVTAYNSSPFFVYYKDDLELLFSSKFSHLVDFNLAVLKFFLKALNVKININLTVDYNKVITEFEDFRHVFNLKNAIYHKSFPQYYQVFADKNGFTENLSVLDLLCNTGPEAKLVLLNVS